MTGSELRGLRLVAGHTQAEAAAVLGVALRTWQYWEASAVVPTVAQLYKIRTQGK